MATWLEPQKFTAGPDFEISLGYDSIIRNGRTVSFNYGGRIRKNDTGFNYNSGTIKNSVNGTQYWGKNGEKDYENQLWYYARYSSRNDNTSEWLLWDYSNSNITEYATTIDINLYVGNNAFIPTNSEGPFTFSVPIPAVKYVITYNANGGSNAPASQNKDHGVNLTITSVVPTRNGYTFLGWSETVNGVVDYLPSSTYTNNSSVTLFAIWQINYLDAYWIKKDINLLPSSVYINMPFNFDIDFVCNYGSSTDNNLLYFEAVKNEDTNPKILTTIASTNSTMLNGSGKSFIFPRGYDGDWTARGVIRFNNYLGDESYNISDVYRNINVSWLNPVLENVSHITNKVNYFRDSQIIVNSSAEMFANSAIDSQKIYTYFTAPEALGDNTIGAGYYYNSSNSINNDITSYNHSGNVVGSFNTKLVLRGDNNFNENIEFNNYGNTTYYMREFVAPTAIRNIYYKKNNIYVGQTKFPITIDVSNIYKSEYDDLIPTLTTFINKDGELNPASIDNDFAIGEYNLLMNDVITEQFIGKTIKFDNFFSWLNINNQITNNVSSSSQYIIKEIPSPSIDDIFLTLSINRNTSVITTNLSSIFDSDFQFYYTLYFENSDGSVIYDTYNDFCLNGENKVYSYNYDSSFDEAYRVKVECKFFLTNEENVFGDSSIKYSNNVYTYNGSILIAKSYDKTKRLYLSEDINTPRPRLVVKENDSLFYLPLYIDDGSGTSAYDGLKLKNGNTIYFVEQM